jgi:hypothetical protein
VFNGWMTDSDNPKGYHTNALVQDGHIVYDSSKSGHEALRVDFEKELSVSEIRHTGWQKIHDADNGTDMLARVDLYYGKDGAGQQQLIGGFVSNVTNSEVSQFMVDGKTGKQVWGIHNEKIATTPDGGTARTGTFSNVTAARYERDHSLVEAELSSMKSGEGSRTILTEKQSN